MKILLIGYGAMNQRVARLAEDKGHEIVGVIEPTPKSSSRGTAAAKILVSACTHNSCSH